MGGKTAGSSSLVINLGSDMGLRGLTSTPSHNWVTRGEVVEGGGSSGRGHRVMTCGQRPG